MTRTSSLLIDEPSRGYAEVPWEQSSASLTSSFLDQQVLRPARRAYAELAGSNERGTGDGGTLLQGEPFWIVVPTARALLLDTAARLGPWISRRAGALLLKQSQARARPVEPHSEAVRWIKAATGLSDARVGRLIGVSRQTLTNWDRGAAIAEENLRRLLAVREVLERAATRSPQPEHLRAWLNTPRGIDGRTPAQLLEANEIDRARLLAMATPSARVARPSSWAGRSVPTAFRAGAERRQEPLRATHDDELAALLEDDDPAGANPGA